MAWNEPGGGNKDPWGGGNRPDQGPPDLDEVVKKLQNQLNGIFGRKGGGSDDGGEGGPRGGGSGSGGGVGLGPKQIGLIAGVLFFIWMATGIYIVGPAERGVVLRFGAYVATTDPGPHWHIPYPIESVQLVNVDEISTFTHKASMLTEDENIVDVELTVQSRIQDAAFFLFQDTDPNKTLRDATEAVVRKTIGASKLDYILTEGRNAVAMAISDHVQTLMDTYKTGLLVTSVNMQPAKPPEQVKEAFDDAIKAREDKERAENKAEAYQNEIIPQARGEAARQVADAKAYRARVIASAEGETARFLSVLAEYQKAPEVTRERLYLETMEQVLAESDKVLVDMPESNSMMYLPLDQMLNRRQSLAPTNAPSATAAPEQSSTPVRRERVVNRERRVNR